MSWDLYVQDWGNVASLEQIPDDFIPDPIGKRSDIIQKILLAEPSATFPDPSRGVVKNEHFSIEFNFGEEDELMSFVMHVRGNELAIPCIGAVLDALNLKATDGSTPYFFDIEKSKEQLNEWIAYRNKVLNK